MKKKVLLFILLVSIASNAQKLIPYNDGEQKLEGVFYNPIKSNGNAILLLPAWKGIDANANENAAELAKLGYKTFVADIYGIDKRPTSTAEAGKSAGYFKTNYIEYQKRIQLALNELIKQGANKNKIAIIGYCFGGTGAIEAARANLSVQGVVSFHGGLGRNSERTIDIIKPKVLVLHGADDFYVSEAEIKSFQDEMRTAKADWQMNYYADAVHGFTHTDGGNDKSKGVAYNEKAAKRSWKAMLAFFDEIFN